MNYKTRAEYENDPGPKDVSDWMIIAFLVLWSITLLLCFALILGA